MKSLFCALALFAMLAPARAQDDAATAPDSTAKTAQADAPKSVKLENGLIVTPVNLPYDELGEMMDAKLWRFNISKPAAPVAPFQVRLVLRTPGERTKLVGFGAYGDVTHEMEVTVGLLPLDKFSLNDADEWRVRMHRRDIAGGETVDNGSSSSTGENPVKKLKNISQSTLGGFGESYGRVEINGESTLITFEHGLQEDGKIQSKLVLIFLVGNELTD